jgi:glycyl-tRNA synthetase beta chain
VVGRGYRLSLSSALDESLTLLEPVLANVKKRTPNAQVKAEVLEFLRDRLRPLWGEQFRADIIDAVVAAGADDLVSVRRRLEALSVYVARPEFSSLAATFKRVSNIVEKQAKDVTKAPVDAGKLTDAAEKTLAAEVGKVRDAVHASIASDDYPGALAKVVPLRPLVDAFFDQVMVMADDRALRENRVRLLMEIGGLFGTVADFSKIQSES